MNRSLVLGCCLFVLGAAAQAVTATTPASKKSAIGAERAGKPAAPAASASEKAPSKPLPTLSVAQIVDKNLAARGGLKAWREVNTLTMSGKLDAGGKTNARLPFVMKMKRPRKSRLEITFQEQNSVQVFDGTHGWKFRPFLGRNDVEPYSPAEAKAASALDDLDGPLVDYAQKGTQVELVGTEAADGHDAYKLKLTTKGSAQRNLWIDGTTFLEVKIDGEPRKIDGKPHKVAVLYHDYKTENGLTTPREFETVVEGVKQTHKMNIEKLAVNEPMDDALFAKPQVPGAVVPSK